MNRDYFKEYDVRGAYGTEFSEDDAYTIAYYYTLHNGKGYYVIGHDARIHSPSLYRAVCDGVSAAGGSVIASGCITTPMIPFLITQCRAQGGIIVTASHNSACDNGIKVFDGEGNIVGGDRLSSLVPARMSWMRTGTVWKSREHHFAKIYGEYLTHIFSHIISPAKKIYRVAIDASHGSAGVVLPYITFPDYIRPIFINAIPDGHFPSHGPNPLSITSQEDVKHFIQSGQADIGFIIDGDGDRIVVINEDGEVVFPEYVWRLMAEYYRYGSVVCTAPSTTFLRTLLSGGDFTSRVFESAVGRKNVAHLLKVNHAEMGFETSGHYYFASHNYRDCALLTLVQVCVLYGNLPYTLSQCPELFGSRIRVEDSLLFKTSKAIDLKKIFSSEQGLRVFDGISFVRGGIYIHIRMSHTESLMRLYGIGDNTKKIQLELSRCKKSIKKYFDSL